MNWARLIKGFLLSFVFLIFFAYLVSGVQYAFGDSNQKKDNVEFAASVLEPVQSDAPELVPQNTPEPTVLQSPLPEINSLAAISVESNLINPDKIIYEKT